MALDFFNHHDLCLDANVFVSAVIPTEATHDVSLRLLKNIVRRNVDLYEPEVVLFEVSHALHRKLTMNEISEKNFEDIMDYFYRLPILLQWREKIMRRASTLARKLSFSGIADCAYLAIAEFQNTTLLTWDDELIRKGKTLYKNIKRVDQFEFV